MNAPEENGAEDRARLAEQIVALCAAGTISAPVALSRLVFAGFAPTELAAYLPAGSKLAELHKAHRARLMQVAEMLNGSGARYGALPGTPQQMLAATAAMFDRAVALQPAASVAAYSLGDDVLLAAATDELVCWLIDEGLAQADHDVLDLGCGIGRVSSSLAGQVRSVLGLDVSRGMIAEACRRTPASNVRYEATDGTPPLHLASESFDLVLAVDCMPYLIAAGIADGHVAQAFRLLRRGGALAVFNLSYRNDMASDIADAQRWAFRFGGQLCHCGDSPFALWDGTAFVVRKIGPERATLHNN